MGALASVSMLEALVSNKLQSVAAFVFGLDGTSKFFRLSPLLDLSPLSLLVLFPLACQVGAAESRTVARTAVVAAAPFVAFRALADGEGAALAHW